MLKMRYNVNTGLYEYRYRLTGEGIFDIFIKVVLKLRRKQPLNMQRKHWKKQEHKHLKQE